MPLGRQVCQCIRQATGVKEFVFVQRSQIEKQSCHGNPAGFIQVSDAWDGLSFRTDTAHLYVPADRWYCNICGGQVRESSYRSRVVRRQQVLVEGGNVRLQCLVRAGDSVQALCLGRQPRIRGGSFLLSDRAGWDAPGQRPVIAVQNILFDQLLKIPWVFRQPFPDYHTVRCGGIAQLDMRAEQRFHDCESNPHAQRLAAADDLMVVDEILEALPVKTVAHKKTERVQYDLPEALCVLRIGFAQVKAQDRLAVSPHHPHGEIKSDARRQHGTGQGRFGRFGKIAPQN